MKYFYKQRNFLPLGEVCEKSRGKGGFTVMECVMSLVFISIVFGAVVTMVGNIKHYSAVVNWRTSDAAERLVRQSAVVEGGLSRELMDVDILCGFGVRERKAAGVKVTPLSSGSSNVRTSLVQVNLEADKDGKENPVQGTAAAYLIAVKTDDGMSAGLCNVYPPTFNTAKYGPSSSFNLGNRIIPDDLVILDTRNHGGIVHYHTKSPYRLTPATPTKDSELWVGRTMSEYDYPYGLGVRAYCPAHNKYSTVATYYFRFAASSLATAKDLATEVSFEKFSTQDYEFSWEYGTGYKGYYIWEDAPAQYYDMGISGSVNEAMCDMFYEYSKTAGVRNAVGTSIPGNPYFLENGKTSKTAETNVKGFDDNGEEFQ